MLLLLMKSIIIIIILWILSMGFDTVTNKKKYDDDQKLNATINARDFL